jgi:hypothetical protein
MTALNRAAITARAAASAAANTPRVPDRWRSDAHEAAVQSAADVPGLLAEVERLTSAVERWEENYDREQQTRLRITADRDAIRGILAVIHRDGGHHTERVGYAQSVDDAHAVWADPQRDRDAMRAALERWRDAKAREPRPSDADVALATMVDRLGASR